MSRTPLWTRDTEQVADLDVGGDQHPSNSMRDLVVAFIDIEAVEHEPWVPDIWIVVNQSDTKTSIALVHNVQSECGSSRGRDRLTVSLYSSRGVDSCATNHVVEQHFSTVSTPRLFTIRNAARSLEADEPVRSMMSLSNARSVGIKAVTGLVPSVSTPTSEYGLAFSTVSTASVRTS